MITYICNYPTVTSKILDPTDEETAISPNPFRATMTLVIKSGIDVPAAKNVSPITYNKNPFLVMFATFFETILDRRYFPETYFKTYFYLRRNCECLSGNGCPPNHQIGESSNPQNTADKGDWEKFSSCNHTKNGVRIQHKKVMKKWKNIPF